MLILPPIFTCFSRFLPRIILFVSEILIRLFPVVNRAHLFYMTTVRPRTFNSKRNPDNQKRESFGTHRQFSPCIPKRVPELTLTRTQPNE